MHQIRFWLRLRPRLHWGAYNNLKTLQPEFKGLISKGRARKKRGRRRWKRKRGAVRGEKKGRKEREREKRESRKEMGRKDKIPSEFARPGKIS